jgi:hypothetical protein
MYASRNRRSRPAEGESVLQKKKKASPLGAHYNRLGRKMKSHRNRFVFEWRRTKVSGFAQRLGFWEKRSVVSAVGRNSAYMNLQ